MMVMIDFSSSGPKEVLAIIGQATPVIRSRSPKSIATIVKVEGASFDSDVISALKDFARGIEPHGNCRRPMRGCGMKRTNASRLKPYSRTLETRLSKRALYSRTHFLYHHSVDQDSGNPASSNRLAVRLPEQQKA